MKLLLHVCCANCLAKTLPPLRDEFPAAEIHLWWFNPNIHPLIEYRRRLKALRVYLERDPLPLTVVNDYGLENFCAALNGDFSAPRRCAVCYQTRLQTAAEAADDFDFFATTLMASREQSQTLLRETGDRVAAATGKKFLYRDCRATEPAAKELNGIYRQTYCGCVFSEADRYRHTSLHLYGGELKVKS
ncbi:MAG: epoxyqueuosine reductase QueH [Planctomycetota bacterium]|jgi:predicted adenine nucleotide alpha hydrolase (AANH) superfamily ATPase|nr:epoxyqueuosine reductase QueH [Planctomycetota bacterium]